MVLTNPTASTSDSCQFPLNSLVLISINELELQLDTTRQHGNHSSILVSTSWFILAIDNRKLALMVSLGGIYSSKTGQACHILNRLWSITNTAGLLGRNLPVNRGPYGSLLRRLTSIPTPYGPSHEIYPPGPRVLPHFRIFANISDFCYALRVLLIFRIFAVAGHAVVSDFRPARCSS